MKIEETGSLKHKGKKIHFFYFRAYDLPKKRPFKIINRYALGCTYMIFEGFVLKDSKFIQDGEFAPFLLIYLGGFKVRESAQLFLVDKEKGITDSTNYLSYSITPAIAKSFKKTPYYISVNPLGYFFDIEGIKSYEKITTIPGCEDMQEMTYFASVDGRAATLFLIYMDIEKARHSLHFEVRSKTDTIVIDFFRGNWGFYFECRMHIKN